MTATCKGIELAKKFSDRITSSTVRLAYHAIAVGCLFFLCNFWVGTECVEAIDAIPLNESIQSIHNPVADEINQLPDNSFGYQVPQVAATNNARDAVSQKPDAVPTSPRQPSPPDSQGNFSESNIEKDFNVVTLEDSSTLIHERRSPRWRASGEFLAWLRGDGLRIAVLESVTDEVLYEHDLKPPTVYGAKVRLQQSFTTPELRSESKIGELLLDFRWIGISGDRQFRFLDESEIIVPAAIPVQGIWDYTKKSNLNSFELNLLGVEKDTVGRGGIGFRYLRMTDRLVRQHSIEHVGFPGFNETHLVDVDTTNDLFGFQFLGGARRKFRLLIVETEFIFGPFVNRNRQSGTLYNEFTQSWSNRRFDERDTGLSMLVESSIGLGLKLTERLALTSSLSSLLLFETINSRNAFGSPTSPKTMSYIGLGVAASYNY